MGRSIFGLMAAGFAGLIAWAAVTGDFWAAGAWLTTDPWGIVTLTDLYLGFLLIAVVIIAVEGMPRGLAWVVPLPFLGNVWTLVWFAVRLPHLLARLRR